MLNSVAKCGRYCIFKHTGYHKIDNNITTTVKRCVYELVSPRTMGHLIENDYSDLSLFVHEVYSGVPSTAFLVSGPVIERHLDSTAIMLLRVWGHIIYNNCVLCGSIFFIRIPHKLYIHWLWADYLVSRDNYMVSRDKFHEIEIISHLHVADIRFRITFKCQRTHIHCSPIVWNYPNSPHFKHFNLIVNTPKWKTRNNSIHEGPRMLKSLCIRRLYTHQDHTEQWARSAKMICFAGTNLPHQISNLEIIAHFPMPMYSAVCTHSPSSAGPVCPRCSSW